MTADNVTERAAQVILNNGARAIRDGSAWTSPQDDDRIMDDCRDIAQALANAGLLTKRPRLEIEGEWLVEVVDYHTCGAGPGSGAGHEPGCGSIPVARLVTPEHDAEVAAKALREAAPRFRHDRPSASVWAEMLDLADQIEAGES